MAKSNAAEQAQHITLEQESKGFKLRKENAELRSKINETGDELVTRPFLKGPLYTHKRASWL
jgi:hypothetical protein